MNSILITLSTVMVIVYAQHLPAAQYPAGVDPALCPGYPNCDNALLHNAKSKPAWSQPQQQWSQQQWSQQQWSQPQWAEPQQNWNVQPSWNYQEPQWQAAAIHEPVSNDLSGGDKYPAGVSPQSCPNYPYCDINASAHSAPVVAPLPGWTERLYPAGVSPSECPNFPYCH